jgi:hypothetical protein
MDVPATKVGHIQPAPSTKFNANLRRDPWEPRNRFAARVLGLALLQAGIECGSSFRSVKHAGTEMGTFQGTSVQSDCNAQRVFPADAIDGNDPKTGRNPNASTGRQMLGFARPAACSRRWGEQADGCE